MPRVDTFFNKAMKKTDIVRTARDVIYNKYVLYAVFLAALFDLLYSVVKEDYLYCSLFILIGFLIAFFNKNMTVILILTMAFATILRNILRGNALKVEGLEGIDTEDEDNKSNGNDEDPKILPNDEAYTNKKKVEPLINSQNTSKTTPSKLMDDLKEKALDLQDTQKHIISGFEKIEPYMDKAETLIGDIQKTALTIQDMRNKQQVKSDNK